MTSARGDRPPRARRATKANWRKEGRGPGKPAIVPPEPCLHPQRDDVARAYQPNPRAAVLHAPPNAVADFTSACSCKLRGFASW